MEFGSRPLGKLWQGLLTHLPATTGDPPAMDHQSDAKRTVAKRTIAERISEKLHVGQTQTLQVIQAFLEEVIDELALGNRLEFRDFGVFETVERKPRMALNPKTLEKVPVGRKIVVKFKVGRLMKAKVGELGERLMAADRAKAAAEANGQPPAAG